MKGHSISLNLLNFLQPLPCWYWFYAFFNDELFWLGQRDDSVNNFGGFQKNIKEKWNGIWRKRESYYNALSEEMAIESAVDALCNREEEMNKSDAHMVENGLERHGVDKPAWFWMSRKTAQHIHLLRHYSETQEKENRVLVCFRHSNAMVLEEVSASTLKHLSLVFSTLNQLRIENNPLSPLGKITTIVIIKAIGTILFFPNVLVSQRQARQSLVLNIQFISCKKAISAQQHYRYWTY